MDQKIKEAILQKTKGVLSTITDLVLWKLFYISEVSTSFSKREAWGATFRADRLLEEVNYKNLKRALINAKKRGLVSYKGKGKNTIPEITQEGKGRLEAVVPHYDEKRVWDGKIYLITYDIPETRKKDRELLREYLRRIGAGLLQESVWLTPYDPRKTLKDFLDNNYLRGQVLISVLKDDFQLPFSLLPNDCLEEKAYQFLRKI